MVRTRQDKYLSALTLFSVDRPINCTEIRYIIKNDIKE